MRSFLRSITAEDERRQHDAVAVRELRRMLIHCKQNVPYYRRWLREFSDWEACDPREVLARLPVLTKASIRVDGGELRSADLNERHWYYNTSGGSTGEPVKLVQDADHKSRGTAIAHLVGTWAGKHVGERELCIWGSERDILHNGSGLFGAAKNFIRGVYLVNAFRMTEGDMVQCVQAINSLRVKLIVAYAQAIFEIASFADRKGLRVEPQQAIMTSAGTLYPFMRQKLEKVFQCKVYNRYGSREVNTIACQCGQMSGLHVTPWSNYVEIVDKKGQRVEPGIVGDIVVTCLTNYAMPLVRYAIGDRAALTDRICCCGRRGQILESVQGRVVDCFRNQDGALIDGEYFTHLLYFRDWVRQFQIVQKTEDSLEFNIVAAHENWSRTELDVITAGCRAVMGQACQVRFNFVDRIDAESSGKYRYTKCEVRANEQPAD